MHRIPYVTVFATCCTCFSVGCIGSVRASDQPCIHHVYLQIGPRVWKVDYDGESARVISQNAIETVPGESLVGIADADDGVLYYLTNARVQGERTLNLYKLGAEEPITSPRLENSIASSYVPLAYDPEKGELFVVLFDSHEQEQVLTSFRDGHPRRSLAEASEVPMLSALSELSLVRSGELYISTTEPQNQKQQPEIFSLNLHSNGVQSLAPGWGATATGDGSALVYLTENAQGKTVIRIRDMETATAEDVVLNKKALRRGYLASVSPCGRFVAVCHPHRKLHPLDADFAVTFFQVGSGKTSTVKTFFHSAAVTNVVWTKCCKWHEMAGLEEDR